MSETTIRLEDDLGRLLAEAAERQGRSQTELIREALERYLAESRLQGRGRSFTSLGAGEDPNLHAEKVHDLIARAWKER